MSQAQEVYATLLQVDKLLADIELKIDNLQGKGAGASKGSVVSLRKGLHEVNMYLIAMERWSGTDSLSGMINRMQSAFQFATRLKMAYDAIAVIQTAVNAGMGPWGWAMIGLEVGAMGIGLALSAQNMATTWSQ